MTASNEEIAQQLYKQKRYKEALPLLEEGANAGSAWAHGVLGWMYWYGHAVRKDRDRSLHHYQLAHDGGDDSAAHPLGLSHFEAGRPELALEWFRKDRHRPISSLYWQYRTIEAHPHLAKHAGEADDILLEAADSGHLFAKRDVAFRMMKGHKRFGTRRQGLFLWLGIYPDLFRLGLADLYDERLR
ncbi:tetratricopeptide repeat protein [Rhizobium ruizarguesonis]|jgi:TPR repeat protein|uniref:tetratricopeptide repeat protein n=1 Tax=Rhizobium ruizarguesonis TaxID=2081791 RepID=UPI00046288F4|nr:sel1 repeat family protein [Rhizobium ruizarguesonis]MBY5848659.1 sel1 repeat family protein [Rhizobium leguminosarum]NKL32184.1 sel1 repeat family protein [Rhizobium leguminosarum bv. viciae]MBY5855998.1 sel1 repeat family protein [Rhizobium leguminosarum]MBY5891574.1 sel1 repeat family protein [Rhizobium leguminosarum]NEH89128.1 sel1 repeat family protein [Rhizobium ruizarguesonis]